MRRAAIAFALEKTVFFSPVFFLAGTAVDAPHPVISWRDLAGRTVAVSIGIANAAVRHRSPPP